MFEKLATFAYSNRRRALFVAVLGAAIAGAFGAGVSSRMSPYGADDPATQSVQAKDRFQAASGRQIDPGVIALVASGDVRSRAARQRVESVAAELGSQPDVASVQSFYTTDDPAMVARGGRSTYVMAYFKALSDKRIADDAKQIESRFSSRRDVKLGGSAIADAQVNTQVGNDLAHAELLAFPLIFLLSLIFFRSVVASLLPPLLGGLAILGTFFLLRIVSKITDLSVFALNLTTGLGLGLAIDYSLFVVSRYREEAARDGFGPDALRRTLQTAGRTVLFSSMTVAAAVASLAIFPQLFLYSMGIAGAIVALLAATLALTVLPALLALLGPRVNALSPPRLLRAAERDARPARSGAWYRLAQFVTRRPAQVAVASAAVLVALGVPFTQIRFITADERVLPPSASAHQVHDALDTQFPPNRTAPLEVVVGAPPSSPAVRALTERIARLPDVSAVSPAQPAGRDMSLLQVAPVHGPLTAGTEQLVRDVRAIHTPYYLGVAGETASYLDLEHSLGAHLPAVLAVVIAATLIVLFLMTGSVVLPIKAVLMNALSLSAVFGILVLIFQARQPPGTARVPQPRRARRHPADPAVRDRLRARHRLRRVPAGADQGSARRRRAELGGGGAGARTDRAHRHQCRTAVRRRRRGVRDLADRVHQGTRDRSRARRPARRLDRAGLAGSLVDGSCWDRPTGGRPVRCGGCYERIGLRETAPQAA